MAHGVDDGVQAGGDLGDEGGDLGHEGGDGALAANDGGEDDESIGSPDAGPEGDVGHGHLGDPDFGGFSGGASVGAKGVDVHLLGLFTESVLMGPDSLNNGAVEEEDDDHGDQVAEEEAEEDVGLVVPVVLQVVIGAGEEHALGGVAAPNVEQGGQGDADGVAPDGQDDGHGFSGRDLSAVEALDNDIVPVVSNHHHGEDGSNAADGSSEAVQFASKSSPDPVSLHENVDGDSGAHGGHHDQVGDGQVDDEHIGLIKAAKSNIQSRVL